LNTEDLPERGKNDLALTIWNPSASPTAVSFVFKLLWSHTRAVVGLKFVTAAWFSPKRFDASPSLIGETFL
jgi:hypothetical protein